MSGAAFALAARSLIGTPFRLHGRDPASGLDCVGLVHAALTAIGREPPTPGRYALRNLQVAGLLSLLPHAGFVAAEADILVGDLVIVKPAPAQFHLAIAGSRTSFIHAHAAIGRVVESPAPLPWPVAGHWRLA